MADPKDPWGLSNVPFATPGPTTPAGPAAPRRPTPPNGLPNPTSRPAPAVTAAPPESCCHAHDADSRQHDPACIVGMVMRLPREAMPALLDALDRQMAKRSDAMTEIIVMGASAPAVMAPAKVHAMIDAYNVQRAAAERLHDLLADRRDGVI